MPLDYSKIFKKVLLATTATTLSVGVVSGCSLFTSEKKSTKTASVSKKKKDTEKEKKKDEKKDESKDATTENLNTNDFDEIIDNAKRSSDQNLAGIIENNKTKKKFDDLTDSIAIAAINSDRNLASVIDSDKSNNRFSDLNTSIASATNNPSVSDNKGSKNFVFGGDLNINDGVASADNLIPPINNDKKPTTSGDSSGGGDTKPPTSGDGNNGGGDTNPPTGGNGNDGGGNTNPPTGGDGNDGGGGTNPPTGGDGNDGGTTKPEKPEKDTVAPVITAKQGVTVYVGDSLSADDLVEVKDNKDPNPVVTVGAYDTSKAGEIQVAVMATDASGNRSSTTVTINVVEKEEEKDTEAPIITAKQGVTVHVGDSLTAGDLVEISDNKDPNPVVTVGDYDTSKAGEIQVTVTATDASGNRSSTTVTVNVVEKEEEKDTEAPVITAKQSVTVHVGDSLNAGDLVEVSDNKDPNPVVTVGAYDTSKAGEIQVTVTATDVSGNRSSTTVTVNVVEKEEEKDTEAPVITAKQSVTVHVGDSLNAGDLVEVKDNKDPNLVVTVGAYDTSKPGTISVQVTATDNGGNSSTATVTVNVVEKEEEKDTEAPVITAKQGVTVHVGDKLSPGSLVSVKDNKDPNPVVTVGAYDTSKPGAISVQVTATDKAGNSSTETVNVVVLEKEKPEQKPEQKSEKKPEQKTAGTTSKEQGNGLLASNSNDAVK
ncbi:adhesin [Bacillus zanthoxyli]|uniref:adhesin n=1 Tax=Bacillus toyonensis TaxID=155322 RepID=UPI000BF03573|nr:adhesin [Bacillus toyonensis]PEK45059.1 adhesin [Bacillus toyonensis]HDR7510798.1 adhesin [Bacillus toyonensis]